MWQRNGDSEQAGGQGNLVGFVGQNCTINGTLNFNGTMRIDGRIEGQIVTTGTLIIGEGGQIHADIQAGVVVCGGSIEGNIVARERIQLLAPSVLTGTVRTPLLIIEEGAQFNGTCEMERVKPAPRTDATDGEEAAVATAPSPTGSHDRTRSS
jgi:cytoskeletal protein CcmA (bactofilin family)